MKKSVLSGLVLFSLLFVLTPKAEARFSIDIDGVVVGGLHSVKDHPYLACSNTENGTLSPVITVTKTDDSGNVVSTHDSCNGPVREEVLVIPPQ